MKSKRAPQPQQSDPPTKLLSLRNVENLTWEMQSVQLGSHAVPTSCLRRVAVKHGHDWEDWFRAESELLRPVSVAISESEERISVRVNVFGFDEHELKVGIEPRRVTILGKKETSETESEGGKSSTSTGIPTRS